MSNTVDKINILTPMKAQPHLHDHIFLAMKKDDLHPVFPQKNMMPSTFIDNMKWKGKKDMVAFLIPTALPDPCEIDIPYGAP